MRTSSGLLFLRFHVRFIERVIFRVFLPFFLTKVKVNKSRYVSRHTVLYRYYRMDGKMYFNKISKRNTGVSLKANWRANGIRSARYNVRFVIGNCIVETASNDEKRRVSLRPTGQDITGNATCYCRDWCAIGSACLHRPIIVVVVRSRNQTPDTRRVSQRVQMS
jgi:hypothetical protein